MRYMLVGRIKCGAYWSNVPGYTERVRCSFCKKIDDTEVAKTEQHMRLECENNEQTLAWDS